jgi:hypothetical protein
MAEDPKKLLGMSDDELTFWTLSGDEGSYSHQVGQTVLNMRNSLRAMEAARQTAEANVELSNEMKHMAKAHTNLSDYTKRLAEANVEALNHTKQLAKATWAIAFITLITQAALILLTFRR